MVNNEWLSAFNEMVYGKGDDNMSELSMNDMERLIDDYIDGNPHEEVDWGSPYPIRVGFKRLSESAVIPTKAHASDSGFDLVASEDVIIEPGETAVVPTGIAVQLPVGYEATVRPRSGVTAKTKLRVQIGTIDQAYRGEIGVIVDNITKDTYAENAFVISKLGRVVHDIAGNNISEHGFNCVVGMSYKIRKGDRLAQLVVQPLPDVEAYEVDGDIAESERGADGFGSSGIREGD